MPIGAYQPLIVLLATCTLLTLPADRVAAQGPQLRVAQVRADISAPDQQPRPSPKDPGTATILSVVIIGAGQMYAGDISRGLLMLGGAYGSIIAGAILSSGAGCDLNDLTCDDGNHTPLYLGALAAVGIWVWGIVDAAPTTRRMNTARGLASRGTLLVGTDRDNGVQVGLRYGF